MIQWDGSYFLVGHQRFRAQFGTSDGADPDAMQVFKLPEMIERLADLVARLQPKRILELGILRGGGTALVAELAPEAEVVAVDIRPDAPLLLQRYLGRTKQQDRIRCHYGVDQADRDRLRQIIGEEFGDEPIDLVIDDASHELDRSRATLDAVLPFVRPGGCYYLEDWSWAHKRASPEGQFLVNSAWPDGPPLNYLVFEMIMAVGSNPSVLASVDVDTASACAWRGDAALDPESFSLRGVTHVPEGTDFP